MMARGEPRPAPNMNEERPMNMPPRMDPRMDPRMNMPPPERMPRNLRELFGL
jgi:hypothetical protein